MKLCASSQFPFVCLGDCGEVVTGSTPPKANSDYWGGEIPFVTPAQLGFQPPITTADEYVTSDGADHGRLLPEGAVLVCCIGSLGKTGTAGVPLISNQQINAIIFDPIQVDARYGYHAARSLTPLLEHFAPSTTVKIVKKSAFAEFQIPLPPLAEQKRIAAILDAADALRAKRREALAQLDTLLQSTFLNMFGDPLTNPMGWGVVAFESIGNSRLGKMLDKGKEVGDCQFPYLANTNVQWGRFDLAALRTMDFSESDCEEFKLEHGDLLICEGGEVGRTAIWHGAHDRIYFQKALHRVRLDPTVAVPEYVFQFMWFMAKNGGFRDLTTSATIAHLTGVKLKRLPCPRPPLELQHRFAAIVESVEQQKASQRTHLAELDTLFASLQSRAFRGDL